MTYVFLCLKKGIWMATMTRIGWHNLWIDFAELVSKRSSDPKFRVGCVIVSKDNSRVLGIGYNGDHKGGSNKRDSMESGESGFIHAEINALIKSDFNFNQDKIMYTTHSPCHMCSKAIINAGIKEVYYKNLYNKESVDFLRKYISIVESV